MQSIEIHMLPYSESTNISEMEHIANIVNRVYEASERSLWKPGASRTTAAEIAELAKSGEIAVAQSMGQIVGCVRVRQIDQETGEFGMLAVDEKYQGTGIGRELIRFAEQKCQNEQLRKMQLELLVPQEGTHPDKVILEKWYTRLGYQPIHTETTDASFPRLAEMLAIPCKFIVFQKNLR
ncbi:GNAT family N-acetyltransferase [Bacillus sp. JJ1533]|uniref:GNAT family N-acetyltransferase n=1 Tax=Bacillus sp. JJ1533 TaxID=3122959 RepID=UPI00300087D8